MPLDEQEESTQPGRPRMLEGPPEARALAELAALVRFYAGRLEQVAAEMRRDRKAGRAAATTQETTPTEALDEGRRAILGRDLREMARDLDGTAERIDPRRRGR